MRDWDEQLDEAAAAGIAIYALTTDTAEVLAKVVPERGYKTPLATVKPEQWADWGLANPERPALPWPSTLIVGPDGALLGRVTHTDHTARADPAAVLVQVASYKLGGAQTAASQGASQGASKGATKPAKKGPIDWDSAASLQTARTDAGATLTLSVVDGYHVYGAKESISRPLAVRVTDHPELAVPIPDGEKKVLSEALGEAWILAGEIALPVALDAEGPIAGELDLQICTDTVCSMPRTWSWEAK